jgi:hypothetical protein
MAKFRDNQSGNVFVFESEYDIKSLRKHPGYTEVIEEVKQEVKQPKKTKQSEEV